jgi:hypothetical protein
MGSGMFPTGVGMNRSSVKGLMLIRDLPPTRGSTMRKTGFYLIIPLALCCLALPCCSGSKEPDQTKASDKSRTEQTVEAIEEYGKKPLDKARAAQQLGEERSKAIDESLKGQ